jgi:hypothetical protein
MPDDSYSIKEIVDATRQEQTAGFTRVEVLLAAKADKADLEPIHRKLDDHSTRIRTLEDDRVTEAATQHKVESMKLSRIAFWSLVGAMGGAAGTIVYAVIYILR